MPEYPRSPLLFPIRHRWTQKPPLGTPIDWQHPLTRHLLACWLFNEGQGNRAYDLTGNAHDITFGSTSSEGTYANWSSASPPQIEGTALELLPTSGTIPVTSTNMDSPIIIDTSRYEFTAEFWVARRSGNTTRGILLSGEVAPGGRIALTLPGSGQCFLEWQDTFIGTITGALDLHMDTWHHLVVQKKAVNNGAQLTFWVDAQPSVALTVNESLFLRPIQWGRVGNDGAAQAFSGLLGLARIWNAALNQDNITALYTAPFAMFATRTAMFRSGQPPLLPAKMQWAAQAIRHANRTIRVEPSLWARQAQAIRLSGQLAGGVVPARVRWKASPVERSIDIQPVRQRWKGNQQRLPIGLNLRDCGETYEAALQQTIIRGDWLIQAPDIGLKVSCNYEGGGGWEHRLVDISDIEISAPPGGGIAAAGNVTVTIAENQHGQSILKLWEQASAVENVEVTIDFLLTGESNALRIYTGRIDSIVVKDALTQLLLVDDSISRNRLVAHRIVTIEDFPQADQAALTRAIPLVYGQGSKIGACPLLFVDVSTNTYLVADHSMTLGGTLAVYDQPTKTFLTLDTIVVIPNNGTGTIILGTLNNGTVVVTRPEWAIAPGAALDSTPATVATIPTPLAGPGYDSAIQVGDGWGYAAWGYRTPAFPQTTTIKIDILNHRRAPGSDPTTTGTFYFRANDVAAPTAIETRKFFISPAFNHVTSAQNNTFILSNVAIGINELFEVLLITRCQGTIGNASQVYQVGEISVTPLVAFSANISGTLTAIGVPINIQELRFNSQRPTLSVYAASSVTGAVNVYDGNSATLALIGTTGIDSNLDGIGELIITTEVTSAQRANNTVAIDLARHRRSLSSTPTVTGTFAIQTYNTNTGVLLRDNLFVTQAFRHQLNPISTSYVATAINLGATAQLAVRVVARNEGGVGGAGQVYEVGEIGVETFYQPRGDSGDVYLYGAGYEGRTDPDGTVTAYIGTTPGRLLQTPDMVIASIYLQELGLQIDLPSFATAYNYFSVTMLRFDGGIGAGWAIEQVPAREVLDALAKDCASILFPTFAGTWGIRPFRAETAIHQTFDATNILTEYGSESQRTEDHASTVQITLGNLQEVSNHFEVRYAYNVGSRKYDRLWKVTEGGSNLPDSDPDKAEIDLLCRTSFLRYGNLESKIVEANLIADDTTALALFKHLVRYFSQQRITVQFETTLKAACLQVGDFITITDTMLPAGDNGGTYEVHTIRYMPMRGRIQLVTSRVSQIPDVTIPDPAPALTGCARLASPGMLACWDFEEASGTRTDHITGLELTEGNGPLLGVAGKVGNAIRFVRASNQYLTNQQALIGAFSGTFTIACWIRMLSIPTDWWAIAGNGAQPTSYPNREFALELGAGGFVKLGVGIADSGGAVSSTAVLPYTGTPADWTLVRAWRMVNAAGTGTMAVQINNGTVVTTAFTGGTTVIAYNNFLLGASRPTGVLGFFADMDLDQLTIWNRVLSQDELDAIWNGGNG